MATIKVACELDDVSPILMTKEAAKLSKTIQNMIDDYGENIDILYSLVNITKPRLQLIVQYCEYYTINAHPANIVKDGKTTTTLTDFDRQFIAQLNPEEDSAELLEIFKASSYLDIRVLIDVCTEYICEKIKGKLPSEIRSFFKITDDVPAEAIVS
jgi:hypothetical protein